MGREYIEMKNTAKKTSTKAVVMAMLAYFNLQRTQQSASERTRTILSINKIINITND